ncbi:MAG: PHP domain-containing protein [Deltaproteobacteria bacterium]|nr:PHP domain-containing protein [Deltaproteobacteria bacterium]MBW2053568.1 PHP domain-containing protein [Deltaproteobacteria bacterium]MBW2142111.1 PHP domain-containing protein [Deltaproteobacteria bacterium]MBW2324087.1 PHP domain-containing protein [Deltaproteobacteria bacterium]
MKIDLHIHTSHGSSCSYMDPVELIERAKAVGLDGVCITEHNQIWDRKAIKRLQVEHNFLVIGGVEVSTDYGEILAFGLDRPVLNVFKACDLKKMVNEAGGAMVLAHPFRFEPDIVGAYSHVNSVESPDLPEEIGAVLERPVFQLVDAVEVYNGRSGMQERDFTAMIAEKLKMKGTGGSDAHATLAVGSCYTIFENEIKNERDLIKQIKKGRIHGVDRRWNNSSGG